MKKTLIRVSKIILVLVLLMGFVFEIYTRFIKKGNLVNIDAKPIAYVYLWNDTAFAKAEELTKTGDFSQAFDEYNNILKRDLSQEDVITKSQLNIRIATLLDAMGEKEAAIEALNQIAQNKNEYFITRSFAYQYMAQMLYETRDPKVLEYIKKTLNIEASGSDPYSVVSAKLLQESESIAPLYLGLTQKMKVDLQSVTVPFTTENTKKYRYDLGIIDGMIKDIVDEQNIGYMLPLALLRKAQVAERLEASGTYGLPKTTEDYYKDAIGAYEKYGEARSYNYVYYEYARYLANKKDATRKTDIENLLAHYKKDVPEKAHLKELLTNITKQKQSKIQYTELQKVRNIAPNFEL